MKKNDFDFSIPRRQSYVAIIIIAYRLYRLLIRQFFPLFIIFLFQGKTRKISWFLYVIIGLAIVASIYSTISFFRYYFYLKGDKLFVNKGVLKKSIVEIPFARIQSVNFEQNLIHRVFNVVKLNIDTAGTAEKELQLYALDHNMAFALREHILRESQHQRIKNIDNQQEVSFNKQISDQKEVIFKLDFPQLIKVGLTENHIRSGFIIIFFFFYVYDSFEDYGIDILEKRDEYLPTVESLLQDLLIVGILIGLFAIVSLIISMVRTVLRFYDLHMWRQGKGFVIQSGLFNRKENAAKDDKIQFIRWTQNWLQKMANYHDLMMRQATSANGADVANFKSVGLSSNNINEVQNYIFSKESEDINSIKMQSVDRYFFLRRMYRWTFVLVPLWILFGFLQNVSALFLLLFVSIYAVMSSWLKYKKKQFGIGHHVLRLNGGTFGFETTLMYLFKVQNISLTETPFQKRRKLASLIIYSAAGAVTIPEIPVHDAWRIKNRLIYNVEKSKRKWM